MWRTSPASARGRAAVAAAVAGSAGGRGIWACGLRLFLGRRHRRHLNDARGLADWTPSDFLPASEQAVSRPRPASARTRAFILRLLQVALPSAVPTIVPATRQNRASGANGSQIA